MTNTLASWIVPEMSIFGTLKFAWMRRCQQIYHPYATMSADFAIYLSIVVRVLIISLCDGYF